MWMGCEPRWPRIRLEMYQIVLAGYPRRVRHVESSHIATGVAGRPVQQWSGGGAIVNMRSAGRLEPPHCDSPAVQDM